MRVTRLGLVVIPLATLPTAGLPNLIHIRRQGIEVPIQISDGEIQFIAQPSDSPATSEAVYWVTSESTLGARITLPAVLTAPLVWERDQVYQSTALSTRGDRWFAGELRAQGATLPITLSLPRGVAAGTLVELALTPIVRRAGHQLQLWHQGELVGAASWDDGATSGPRIAAITLNRALPAGDVTLDLALTSTGTPEDAVLIDQLRMPSVAVPLPLLPTPTLATPALHDLRSGPAPGQAGATSLIISHSDFLPALAPLVAAHQARGHTVAVIDVQHIYDVFSFGERSPEAIRNFIRAAMSWQLAPRSVLLVGAGNVRMRPQANQGDITFIPPYLIDSDPKYGEIACDSCYARLSTNLRTQVVPDLPIGRLPVHTLAEAHIVVAKTVQALIAPPSGTWRQTMLAIADNDLELNGTPDQAGPFSTTADAALAALPDTYRLERFFYTPQADTTAFRQRLFQAWDAGAAMLMYTGHASLWQWAWTNPDAATPHLVGLYDADARTNGARLPILLAMTCLSGNWANPTLQPIDERLLLRVGGGTVASLSPLGSGVQRGHTQLLAGVVPALGAGSTLGAAHLAGLKALAATGRDLDLAFSFGILGDPELTLPAPTQAIYLPLTTR
ncbi:MAG: hypothetical protein H7Z42_21135 [Roseiflexaceae bacterium]|nr:hypothetical protein [Roseiflexaceae bacterium]